MNGSFMRIAIDGPSGSGKSTVARRLATEYGLDYIDTGAMYRAIAYKMNGLGIKCHNDEAKSNDLVVRILNDTTIDFNRNAIILDGNDVSQFIRTSKISMLASDWSACALVREKLVSVQREMCAKKSVVMDGRDIGTNVIPDAEFKFFITAEPKERAKRRYEELIARGQNASYDDVLKDIEARDIQDSTRSINPLKKAKDAILIDTTDMSIEKVILAIKEIIGQVAEDKQE